MAQGEFACMYSRRMSEFLRLHSSLGQGVPSYSDWKPRCGVGPHGKDLMSTARIKDPSTLNPKPELSKVRCVVAWQHAPTGSTQQKNGNVACCFGFNV